MPGYFIDTSSILTENLKSEYSRAVWVEKKAWLDILTLIKKKHSAVPLFGLYSSLSFTHTPPRDEPEATRRFH